MRPAARRSTWAASSRLPPESADPQSGHVWINSGSVARPIVSKNDQMASWREIEQDAPGFAARAQGRFEAGTNKTLATLRRDGSPRIGAAELEFSSAGEVTLGMMPRSMKLLDVRRDPRAALHGPTLERP